MIRDMFNKHESWYDFLITAIYTIRLATFFSHHFLCALLETTKPYLKFIPNGSDSPQSSRKVVQQSFPRY